MGMSDAQRARYWEFLNRNNPRKPIHYADASVVRRFAFFVRREFGSEHTAAWMKARAKRLEAASPQITQIIVDDLVDQPEAKP